MIKELHAGDRQIPASGWNEMRAAVQGITPGQQQYQSGKLNPVYITVKNVTGSDLPAFSVVKLSGATYTRTGETFINQAIAHGVELDGDTPAAVTDTVAITQAACEEDGFVKAIASGCSPCYVQLPSRNSRTFKYAVPIADNTEMLKATDNPSNITILWHNSGSGKQPAYVRIDAVDDKEYFVINHGKKNGDTPTHTPTIFTKGSLHYIKYNSAGYWEPSAYNEVGASSTLLKRPPDAARLVVCQIDAPNSAAECKIPYYTPESNMGIPASFTSSVSFFTSNRCGCKPGEHTFTDKMCDYAVTNGSYEYNPQFTGVVTVDGTVGGAYDVYADVCGNNWLVNLPNANAGLSAANYPDIYPYDQIAALIDCESQVCYALDYARDYEAGYIMPYYNPPGRGWDTYATPQVLLDVGLQLYIKVKTGAIT